MMTLSQNVKTTGSYIVKYYFPDSTIVFNTNNLDSIRTKTSSSSFVPDSLETYKNGKLTGPKKIFSDPLFFDYDYKNGEVIFERVYNNDTLLYSSSLDSTSLAKTELKLASHRNYFDQEKGDTIIVSNPTIPAGNMTIYTVNLWITKLSPNSYRITIANKEKRPKEVIVKVQTYLGNDKSRIEEFKFPVE